jgi:hypothetical protein
MARKPNYGYLKMQRERDKQKKKEARLLAKKRRKEASDAGLDPDLVDLDAPRDNNSGNDTG